MFILKFKNKIYEHKIQKKLRLRLVSYSFSAAHHWPSWIFLVSRTFQPHEWKKSSCSAITRRFLSLRTSQLLAGHVFFRTCEYQYQIVGRCLLGSMQLDTCSYKLLNIQIKERFHTINKRDLAVLLLELWWDVFTQQIVKML